MEAREYTPRCTGKQIPGQFEFIEVYYQFKNRPEASVFVTVLDVFNHHYTGTKMYHIRLEHDGTFGFDGKATPFVDYKTVEESQMIDMLSKRKKG